MANKYHARKVTIDGITFDSLAESRRYTTLKYMQMTGEISGLRVHTPYTVIPAFTYQGKKVAAITYEPDFDYRIGSKQVAEDVKSPATKTEVFRVKQKLFWLRFPDIELRIIPSEEC
jgi:hypothetical protein